MKFIADNHIQNVVFLTTDDHQTRVSELQYQPDPTNPSRVATVPGTFQVLTGPLGAGGPDAITDHSFSNLQALTNQLVATQVAQGIHPVGLDPHFMGLHDVIRQLDPNAGTNPSPVDFYSPDTFASTTFDLSPDGQNLTTNVWGIPSYAANTFPSAGSLPPQQLIMSFQVSALAPVPEPASGIMIALGLTSVGVLAWRSRRPAA